MQEYICRTARHLHGGRRPAGFLRPLQYKRGHLHGIRAQAQGSASGFGDLL